VHGRKLGLAPGKQKRRRVTDSPTLTESVAHSTRADALL